MNSKDWDYYWSGERKRIWYDFLAWFYRKFIISPSERFFLRKHFKKGSILLHAGCGSGETDKWINNFFKIVAVDFSKKALEKYKKNNPYVYKIILSDIEKMPFRESTFDGIYNLGVFEHYSKQNVLKILKEFHRVLKKNGKVVIFWPPEFGFSVFFFKALFLFLKTFVPYQKVKLYPDEVNRLKSKKEAEFYMRKSGFKLIDYYFGVCDLFTYCVLVGQKA
ncbi:MAG: hypothetical protein KatS3mg088_385 [Patescibacteria group bacterium]|nr:MAG: hypothetical protein KatS3mg088_385 [Patescibacteria group bacterium]